MRVNCRFIVGFARRPGFYGVGGGKSALRLEAAERLVDVSPQ